MLAQNGSPAHDGLALQRLSRRISNEAAQLVFVEPLLAGTVAPLLTAGTQLHEMLAWHLAGLLGSDSLSRPLLHALFTEVFEANSHIVEAAASDLQAALEQDPASESALQVLLHMKGYLALQTHRIAHVLWKEKRRALAFHLQSSSSRAFSVDIHPAACIGAGVMLDHATGIVIGETSVIGNGVSLFQGVTLGGTGKARGDRHPKLGDGVVVGAGAVLLGPISIGDQARIGAGSVVLHDVPAKATAVGVPAHAFGLV